MGLLLTFAFLAGLVTILAPCIWPLLPIIVSSSVASKGKYRPMGITVGLMISFGFLTLALSYLVRIFHFNPNVLRIVAVIVIGILGLTMVVPFLSTTVESFLSEISGRFKMKKREGTGFSAGFLTGLSLGVVWSPCAGPILAAIATLAATGKVTFEVMLVTLVYVCGVGIPLFIVAYGGRGLVLKTRLLSAHLGRIQQAFGIVMILTAIAIYTNYDAVLEAKLLNIFPQFGARLTNLENNRALAKQLEILKGHKSTPTPDADADTTGDYFNADFLAPDLKGVTQWLNTDKALSIRDLKGSIVLVDFWTYTCINCINALPHLTSWYKKYKDRGFTIIGCHTPEFEFEHSTKNVSDAMKRFHIEYPVAQDNDYAIWNGFNNQYWPAEYLVDGQGRVRRTHFGEGEYDQMEMAIRDLLKIGGPKAAKPLDTMANQTPSGEESPETYVGAERMEYYYPSGRVKTGENDFVLSNDLKLNSFSFGGKWNIRDSEAVAGNNAELNYHFQASRVFLVLRPAVTGPKGRVRIFLDGKPLNDSRAGADVSNGRITVTTDRLYDLIDTRGKTENHVLLLLFETPGIEVFAFTFG